jgi:hypothetical protein
VSGQRRKHAAGDWFSLQLDRDGSHRVGVIVKTGDHTPTARFPGGLLVYLYEPALPGPPVDPPEFGVDRLLMPPVFTHPAMWSSGCFRTFGHRELRPEQLVPQHCFLNVDFRGDEYVDENDEILDRRHEPCGRLSLPTAAHFGAEIQDAVDGVLAPVRHRRGRASYADL